MNGFISPDAPTLMPLPPSVPQDVIDQAIGLARELQQRATELQSPAERRQQAEFDRMLQNPADKVTLVQLTDQAFRCQAAARTAEHLNHILDVQGVPRFFSPLDQALLRGFQTFGGWLPGVAVPLVREHMRHETANVVLPAETELLTRHLAARAREGLRMNLNFLGEALAGEAEAQQRLERYFAALELPEVEVLSVKISTIYSQVSPLAREQTLGLLCDRLEPLYRAAARQLHPRPDGPSVPKMLYLDMEEYRDLHLTAQAFMRTLDRPGLAGIGAGIALQAYIPDSARVQLQLNAWARRRVEAGGAPITLRIVKGANMEQERVEASLRDWPQAPFRTKRETDANYQRMLREALLPENLAAVRVGVASHNLFDLAHGLVLAEAAGAGDRVQFEMLEGMANHQRRALREHASNLLLYAPACRRPDFLNAIAYLIRRLDENSGPDNFLRHAFRLQVGSPDWQRLELGFREASTLEVSDAPRRLQDRRSEVFDTPQPEVDWREFRNAPDTDWSLPANGHWAEGIVARRIDALPPIPLVIAGEPIFPASNTQAECRDPSLPEVVLTHYRPATVEDVNRAVVCARADPDHWRTRSVGERSALLGQVAQEFRRDRADLIRAALANTGKTVAEADPEVSEAVDFVEFYRASARDFWELSGVMAQGRGVVVVVSPWNFPIAIPAGGIAAALAAGNTVILKPASDAVLVAWELCQCFWRGGVPRTALQFVPGSGSGAGRALVAHPEVNAVILTGGTATALQMLAERPALRLHAETGGKNATIVTALSDRELAVKHVVQSAFSHSGQKCSATSLLLLETEVYEDGEFRRMLVDAVSSLRVGSAWDLATRMGPLIRPPTGDLARALTSLEPGESWAVQPRRVGDNPHLWSPGVKYGVQPGSVTHRTEFFGPVLGVMRFDRLHEAIGYVNATGYGLTSGLQSLDDREHAEWLAGVRAGNLYLNRSTVGAIVLRQPFGGTGRSSVGAGLKAGGPNYVAQLMNFEDSLSLVDDEPLTNADLANLRTRLHQAVRRLPRGEVTRLRSALESYDRWWREEFSGRHDHFRLVGQDNLRRYQPFREIRVRAGRNDSLFEIVACVAAARVTGARVIVSTSPGPPVLAAIALEEFTQSWAGGIEFWEETDEQLGERIRSLPPHADERLRFPAPERVPTCVRAAAAAHGIYVADEPVLAEGRIELLWYLREQSQSVDYHRHGHLGARAEEARREPE